MRKSNLKFINSHPLRYRFHVESTCSSYSSESFAMDRVNSSSEMSLIAVTFAVAQIFD